ncbi:probable 39S ribosomal protein L49, mitochondrial [Frieseomelitta varia]|uniref:probable 39S ribosomal protein L49, mitochondrial n=1 Tax=Frieseomelitta varia TaxID=561572 RepID=UPI001CB68637|nr:probable 39S ribosomal protein L49, mitochondrial [Frieseomelitta varia]
MAALRLFARTRLSTLVPCYPGQDRLSSGISPVIDQIQKRWGTYMSSPKYKDSSEYTDYEVTKDPKEWEYVERLLKPKVIPAPCLENKEYPSGWKPPVAKPHDYPYYIPRTKNYMQPVYLEIFHRGLRRVTTVRKIHGDIWTLESELKEYIEKRVNKPIGIRTNELLGEIKFRGDYVNLVKAWMDERGF